MQQLTIGPFAVDSAQVLSEVTAQCDRYETALMDNDLETLDGLFCDSPVTLRYGVGENLYGIDAIRDFRKGRTGGSPKRVVTRREITCFGDAVAICNLEFKRENTTVVGRQSQTWLRTDAGWRIVSAHVSLMAATS